MQKWFCSFVVKGAELFVCYSTKSSLNVCKHPTYSQLLWLCECLPALSGVSKVLPALHSSTTSTSLVHLIINMPLHVFLRMKGWKKKYNTKTLTLWHVITSNSLWLPGKLAQSDTRHKTKVFTHSYTSPLSPILSYYSLCAGLIMSLCPIVE